MSQLIEYLAAIPTGVAAGYVVEWIEWKARNWWELRKLREQFRRSIRVGSVVYTVDAEYTFTAESFHEAMVTGEAKPRPATRPDDRLPKRVLARQSTEGAECEWCGKRGAWSSLYPDAIYTPPPGHMIQLDPNGGPPTHWCPVETAQRRKGRHLMIGDIPNLVRCECGLNGYHHSSLCTSPYTVPCPHCGHRGAHSCRHPDVPACGHWVPGPDGEIIRTPTFSCRECHE